MLTGSYHFPRADVVRFGTPWQDALRAEVECRNAQRVFVLAGSSLATLMPLERALRETLTEKLVGFATGIKAHTPLDAVFSIARTAQAANADLLVAIGGGSVIDGSKVVQLVLAGNVTDIEGLAPYRGYSPDASRQLTLKTRVVAIPTTLSGAEFTAFAGASDTAKNVKQGYGHPDLAPVAVILDPRITVFTPPELWLSTGIRAVDHAVEDLCSINSQPLADAASIHAIKLLAANLRITKTSPDDLDARLQTMIGVWLSLVGTQGGVQKGASHAIGHILGGSAGVPHGLTSCVMLPHVLRWNAAVNADRQQIVSEAFGAPSRSAADLVAELISFLALPSSLHAVGVGRDQFQRLAELSMHDPWTATNPRKIDGPADIMTLLEAAA